MIPDVADEVVEQEFRVYGAARGLRVELHREEGKAFVPDAFARAVVQVDEVRFPVGAQRVGVDREAVIL